MGCGDDGETTPGEVNRDASMEAAVDASADATVDRMTSEPDATADASSDATSDADAMVDAMTPRTCMGGDTYTYVLNVIDYAAPDSGISEGFDIDGMVSDATDVMSCNKVDFTSPAPASAPGVDNQMGVVLDLVRGFVDVSMAVSEGLSEGTLIVLLQVRHVDDLMTDDCVTLDVLFGRLPMGVSMPALDGMGRILAGQTFDINASRSFMPGTMTPLVSFPGSVIAGGTLEVQSLGTWPVDFPTDMGRATVNVMEPRARFDITPTSLTNGVVGGVLDVAETSDTLVAVSGQSPFIVNGLLSSNADLDRIGGTCTSISLALTVAGVPATLGMTR